MTTALTIERARPLGMAVAVVARDHPQRPAILSSVGDRSFGELNANANRLARHLRRAGLGAGDGLALLCGNRPQFAEAWAAAMRCGLRLTPVDWHLTPDEVAYIVADCEARAVIADAAFAAAAGAARRLSGVEHGLAVGGALAGFQDWDAALADEAGDDIGDPVAGERMLYTSGTTGRPKGVKFLGQRKVPLLAALTASARLRQGDLLLNPSPLYHAAPLNLNLGWALNNGMGMATMARFDAEGFLAAIARHRISHSHVVPAMLQRLLELPAKVREGYDLSSLRWLLHGSAPCPVALKERAIAWLGPILHEFFGGTEGALVFSTPRDWDRRKGSVGRAVAGGEVAIFDDDGRRCPAGTIGKVYQRAGKSERFVYFKAPEKTAAARLPGRSDWHSMGDLGWMDRDGYLYLTGRSADTVISGGVNIYPAEIERVLNDHPAVAEAVCIGAPSQRWGEEVVALVRLCGGDAGPDGESGDGELGDELLRHCRARLAAYKVPKSLRFVAEFPRSGVGKVLRRELRRDHLSQGREAAPGAGTGRP